MSTFEDSILRVMKGNLVVGTAFLVARDLAVTCAHLIENAMGGTIQLQLQGQGELLSAQVIPEYYRDPKNGDIAFLRLDRVVGNIKPLRLGAARNSGSGNPFQTFANPSEHAIGGVFARGWILGMGTENGKDLLQLRSQEMNMGYSGAPVWDEKRRVVVGIVVSVYKTDSSGKLRDTAFAIPSETLWHVCPEILASEIGPYLGLDTFTEETARFFFGREALTEKLINVLRGGCRFLAVFGSSGSGKSSVVRAGLLSALKKDRLPESQKWAQITIRPADNPFEQLQAAGINPPDIDKYLKLYTDLPHLVLFIDQFEEMFTLCPDQIRNRFVRDLATALDNPKLILIISMRDEFYSAFHAEGAILAESQYLQIENVPGTLDRDELVAMIERPAESVGLMLEEGLTELILNDVATRDGTRSAVLPLLEFTLSQLWVDSRDGMLTLERYYIIGGVTGSLARWADDAYSRLTEGDRASAESLLTSLVHLGDKSQGLPDMRRRRTLVEFDEPTQRIIKHFADLRLLVTSGETVELIHDTLLREWKQFATWLDENREYLTWRQKLAERYEEWKNGRAELLRGRELAIAQDYWFRRHEDMVELSEYILASAKQGQGVRLIIVSGITVAFLILASFGVFAWQQRNVNFSLQLTVTSLQELVKENQLITETATLPKETIFVQTPVPTHPPLQTLVPTLLPTPQQLRTPLPTVRPNVLIQMYNKYGGDPLIWLFASIVGVFTMYIIGMISLALLVWRFGSNKIFSRSWLTTFAFKPLLITPGIGAWLLFLGYKNRLPDSCMEIRQASRNYFGLPALGPNDEKILFDIDGNNLHLHLCGSLDSQKPALIIAKGGGGKTTLLARWAHLAITNQLPPSLRGYTPIFVTSSYFKGDMLDTIASVLRERDGVAVDKTIIRSLLETGKYLILLDGISEVGNDQLKWLEEILKFACHADYSSCRFIISMRPGLSISSPAVAFQLLPLTMEVIFRLLSSQLLSPKIINLVTEQFDMFGSKPIEPLLFSMILKQARDDKISPTHSQLYMGYFQKQLKIESHPDWNREWDGWAAALGEFARWFMLDTGYRGVGMIHESLVELMARKADLVPALNLVDRLNRDYGLSVKDELDLLERLKSAGIIQKTKRWQFAHDTFEEYFSAKYIISYLEKNGSIPALTAWSSSEKENGFVDVIKFVSELADDESRNFLCSANIPEVWKKILSAGNN